MERDTVTPESDDWLDISIGALGVIADIAEGSTTANSLPNIARIARAALAFNAAVTHDAYTAGIERAAAWIEQRQLTYVAEHGSTDPSTGTVEFPGNGDEYVYELEEIVEGIRALKSAR